MLLQHDSPVLFVILHSVFYNIQKKLTSHTHRVHVDAVSVRPRVLEILLQSLPERIRDLVEADELFDPEHLHVISRCTWIQPLDDGRNVPEDAGVHQRWRRIIRRGVIILCVCLADIFDIQRIHWTLLHKIFHHFNFFTFSH